MDWRGCSRLPWVNRLRKVVLRMAGGGQKIACSDEGDPSGSPKGSNDAGGGESICKFVSSLGTVDLQQALYISLLEDIIGI